MKKSSSTDYEKLNALLEKGAVKTEKLRTSIINANMGLISEALKTFKSIPPSQYDDFSTICMMAINKAFDKFDSKKGAKFSTVAMKYIENAIKNELKKESRENPGKKVDTILNDGSEEIDLGALPNSARFFGSAELSPEEKIEREEKQKSDLKKAKKLLSANKIPKQNIDIFLDYMGLLDGVKKNYNDLLQLYNVRSGELKSIIRQCERIFNSENVDAEKSNKERNYAYLQEKDLALMNYILDHNTMKDDPMQYPNRQDILRSELSEYFHSVDTVSDSIKRLRDIKGCEFEKKGQKQGFRIVNPQVVDGRLNLSNDELFSISTISVLLNQYKNTPLEKTFRAVWEKVTENLQGVVSNESVFLKTKVSMITDPLPKLDETVFNKILKACRSQRTIQFVYHSQHTSQIDERKADPYQIVCQKGSWYMLAFCHKHKEYRWFSFSRVKKLKILDEKFVMQKDFSLKKFFNPESGIAWRGEAIHVKLAFPKKIALYISERKWYEDQIVTMNEDGSVWLEFSTDNEQKLLSFIMQFCDDVKVLEPAELREKVKTCAKRIAGYY